ncbi:MAG: glycosyltransferase family 4 protein [Actinomycetota bacterium]
MRRHLLVTNDFPPKIGGIQAYLWELWRRLPADEVTVLTTPYRDTPEFDAEQAYRVERWREPVLLPHPGVVRAVNRLAAEVDAELVVIDPALPLGAIGPSLDLPYAVVLHGAEVTVPGRLPISRQLLARTLRGAELVIAAGGYPAAEGERAAGRPLPTVVVPPGVDVDRIRPLDDAERASIRTELGLPVDAPLIHAGSRLVPRKGIDVVLRAADRLRAKHPDLQVVVNGAGRDLRRLELIAADGSVPVHFVGRVPDEQLVALYGAADIFSMLCRTRWAGLEQEGFGIVFLEAAAAGTPQVAGASGGAHEAVVHGETGLVVDDPTSVTDAADALDRVLRDDALRDRMRAAARVHAEAHAYDVLAKRLAEALS